MSHTLEEVQDVNGFKVDYAVRDEGGGLLGYIRIIGHAWISYSPALRVIKRNSTTPAEAAERLVKLNNGVR